MTSVTISKVIHAFAQKRKSNPLSHVHSWGSPRGPVTPTLINNCGSKFSFTRKKNKGCLSNILQRRRFRTKCDSNQPVTLDSRKVCPPLATFDKQSTQGWPPPRTHCCCCSNSNTNKICLVEQQQQFAVPLPDPAPSTTT